MWWIRCEKQMVWNVWIAVLTAPWPFVLSYQYPHRASLHCRTTQWALRQGQAPNATLPLAACHRHPRRATSSSTFHLLLLLLPSGPTGKQAAQIASVFSLMLFCSVTIVERFWKGGSTSIANVRRLETMAVVLVISRCKSWLLLMFSALLFLVLLSDWISLTVKTEDVQRYAAGIVRESFG